jgi:hypothetical protein
MEKVSTQKSFKGIVVLFLADNKKDKATKIIKTYMLK